MVYLAPDGPVKFEIVPLGVTADAASFRQARCNSTDSPGSMIPFRLPLVPMPSWRSTDDVNGASRGTVIGFTRNGARVTVTYPVRVRVLEPAAPETVSETV